MAKRKDILVIGIGRFGAAVVATLLEKGHRVTIVDNDESRLRRFASQTEFAKVADTRDEEVLKQLGVLDYDAVVVGIGTNIEASLITTIILKDMGVQNLYVKANNAVHAKAFVKMGVSPRNIIMPEKQAGIKLAVHLISPIVADYISLLGDRFGIIELYPKKTEFSNKTLGELRLKEKYNVMVAAVRRDEEIILPNRDTIIGENDSMIVIGDNKSLEEFELLF